MFVNNEIAIESSSQRKLTAFTWKIIVTLLENRSTRHLWSHYSRIYRNVLRVPCLPSTFGSTEDAMVFRCRTLCFSKYF
jgi:hypothetical protein